MVGSVNTVQILYIAFRLAPFIIVSYFALNSLMNFTIRGIIYLIGLLLVCFITVISSGLTITGDPDATSSTDASNVETCNIITLTGNITKPLSSIPLSITIYAYTLSYILTSVLYNLNSGEQMSLTNIPTIIAFSLLIIAEFITSSMMSKCFSTFTGILALILGTAGGIVWGALIHFNGSPDMTFYSTASDICTRPSRLTYQCKKQSL